MKDYIVPIGCLVGVVLILAFILFMGWRSGQIRFTFDTLRVWAIALAISFLFVMESFVFVVATTGKSEVALAYQSFVIASICFLTCFAGAMVEAYRKTHGKGNDDGNIHLPGERHPEWN